MHGSLKERQPRHPIGIGAWRLPAAQHSTSKPPGGAALPGCSSENEAGWTLAARDALNGCRHGAHRSLAEEPRAVSLQSCQAGPRCPRPPSHPQNTQTHACRGMPAPPSWIPRRTPSCRALRAKPWILAHSQSRRSMQGVASKPCPGSPHRLLSAMPLFPSGSSTLHSHFHFPVCIPARRRNPVPCTGCAQTPAVSQAEGLLSPAPWVGMIPLGDSRSQGQQQAGDAMPTPLPMDNLHSYMHVFYQHADPQSLAHLALIEVCTAHPGP